MPRPAAQPCADCGRARSGRAPGVPICRCHEKRRAVERRRAEQSARLAALTARLAELDPTVTTTRVGGILGKVAPARHALAVLLRELHTHPEVLTAGGSSMPKMVGEFLYAAIADGITGIVSPGCALCGRPRTLFHTHGDGQRICTTCYSRTRVATCSICGRDGQRIKAHTSDGGPMCEHCRQRKRPESTCDDCGKMARLTRSSVDGLGYCRACQARRAPTEPCSICGQDRRVNARTLDGGAVCTTCYTKTRIASDACGECGTIGQLVARADGRSAAGKNLCVRCYRYPKRECGICGRTRRVSLKATDTSPDICPTCYQAPVIDCSVCGQPGLGRRTTKNGKPWCFACQATQRIDQLLAGPDGSVPDGLKDVRDALVSTSRPRSILNNWDRISSLSLLAKLAREDDGISHERLDSEGNRFSVNYLRAVLVATGILPERDENLARLHSYAARVIASVPDAEQRQTLARYARWHVIARVQADRHGQLGHGAADRCRREIRAAQRFLAHLADRGHGIDDCTQTDIDAWLTVQPGNRVRFVRWLRDHGQLDHIALPEPVPATGPRNHADPEEHWLLIRRMLHDDHSASIEDRVAACLVLLYAQPLAKIAALTVDDIDITDTGTFLRLGPEPLLLVSPLDALVTALPIAKPFGAARTLADPRWLFPGKNAGQHQHPTSLMGRLNRLGITTRASRNTAMLHLASTVPPAVFASLIGISIGAAARWTEYAGGSWTNYAAMRTKTTASPRQNR